MINLAIFFAPFAIFTVHSLPPSSLPVIGTTFVPKHTARIYGVTRGWWSTFNEPQSRVTTVRQTIELSRSKLNGGRPSEENTKIFAVRKGCEENVWGSLANFAFLSRAVSRLMFVVHILCETCEFRRSLLPKVSWTGANSEQLNKLLIHILPL